MWYSSVFEDSVAYHQPFWGTFCHPYTSSATETLYIWHNCLQKEGDCPFHCIIIKTAPIPKTVMLDLSKFTIKSIRLAVLNRTFSWVWRPLTISDNKTTSWERWGWERESERQRQTETDRDRQRQRQRQRQTETETETDRQTQTQRHRQRQTDWLRDRETQTQTQTDRHRDRLTGRQRQRQTDRQRRGESTITWVAIKRRWGAVLADRYCGRKGIRHQLSVTSRYLEMCVCSSTIHLMNTTSSWTRRKLHVGVLLFRLFIFVTWLSFICLSFVMFVCVCLLLLLFFPFLLLLFCS